jgi:hypothetical protein
MNSLIKHTTVQGKHNEFEQLNQPETLIISIINRC